MRCPYYYVITFTAVHTRACLDSLGVMAQASLTLASTSCPSTEEPPNRHRQLGRKRVRHETEWKQADRKAKRNTGREYVTKKKKTVSPTVNHFSNIVHASAASQ